MSSTAVRLPISGGRSPCEAATFRGAFQCGRTIHRPVKLAKENSRNTAPWGARWQEDRSTGCYHTYILRQPVRTQRVKHQTKYNGLPSQTMMTPHSLSSRITRWSVAGTRGFLDIRTSLSPMAQSSLEANGIGDLPCRLFFPRETLET